MSGKNLVIKEYALLVDIIGQMVSRLRIILMHGFDRHLMIGHDLPELHIPSHPLN